MLTRSVSLTGKAFYQIDSRNSDNLDGTIGGNAFELRAGISAFVF